MVDGHEICMCNFEFFHDVFTTQVSIILPEALESHDMDGLSYVTGLIVGDSRLISQRNLLSQRNLVSQRYFDRRRRTKRLTRRV